MLVVLIPAHNEEVGAGGATPAATGMWMDSMALLVTATTLTAAGVSLFKPAPRPRRR